MTPNYLRNFYMNYFHNTHSNNCPLFKFNTPEKRCAMLYDLMQWNNDNHECGKRQNI